MKFSIRAGRIANAPMPAKALADIILHLHEDTVYYQYIADRCLQRAAKFDIHKTVNQYLQLYQSLYR